MQIKKTIFQLLFLIFLLISASNLTILYIAKTISTLQINLKTFGSINEELVTFIFCIFFMYLSVAIFNYNKNFFNFKMKEFFSKNIFQVILVKSLYLNNKFTSNLPSHEILKDFFMLEKFFTKNIEKIFYLPWLCAYLYVLKVISFDIFIINLVFIFIAIFTKISSILFSKISTKPTINSNEKNLPNISSYYNFILSNISFFNDFRFSSPFFQEGKKDYFLYFLGFFKSVNVIFILIYNYLFLDKNNIQSVIIVYILTNSVISFLEKILSFHLENFKKIKKTIRLIENKEFNQITSNNFYNDSNDFYFKDEVVKLKNVYFKYHDIKHYVLENVSLDIFENKINLIYGDNDCGKTTLLKLISGNLKFEKGFIFKKSNKVICFCDENLFFFEKLNFFENLTIFNKDFAKNKDYFDFLIKKLNLINDLKNYPTDLKANLKDLNRISFSLRMKICIFRTLFSNSDILIFDINLSLLDKEFLTNFKEILLNLKKTVVISGNYDIISDVADVIYKVEKNI